MTPPSSSKFPRPLRSHGLLLLAPNHLPAFELGQWPALYDPHDVVDMVLIGLIVGIVFLGTPHRLLHDRMGEAALDPHHNGLILFVAHYDALERALWHLQLLRLGFGPPGTLRLGRFFRRRRCWRGSGLARALLCRDRLDARDVATNLPNTRGILELPGCPLKAQIESLLLELEKLIVKLVDR